MPSAHESVHPAHQARPCAWLHAAARRHWEIATGYGKRSLVETAMFRYQTLIGPALRARTLTAQKAEARVACSVMNCMTKLGRPLSQWV